MPVRTVVPRTHLTAVDGGRLRRKHRLGAVTAPLQARSSTPFLVLCASVLGAALIGVLILNTSMAHGSYEMTSMQRESTQLLQDIQSARESLQAMENTLAARAQGLGMIPSQGALPLDITGAIEPAHQAVDPTTQVLP
jgi:hypothetical protein